MSADPQTVIWLVDSEQEGVGKCWGGGQGPLYGEACFPGSEFDDGDQLEGLTQERGLGQPALEKLTG